MPEVMTPRQRVLAAFAHQEPDRVPCWCGSSPEFRVKAKAALGIKDDEALRLRFGDDFRRVFGRYPESPMPLSPGAVSRTVFGVERHGMGYGQPVASPLAGAGTREVHDYPWPDPASVEVSHVRAEAEAWAGRYAILGGDWSPFWHDAIDLLGMEELCIQMHQAPELVDAVLQHLVDFYFEVSRRTFEAAGSALDVFFIGNDFGSQCGPLVSPSAFERFLLPHLARLIDLGHAFGLKVQLHCCGGVAPLLGMMVAAGLDAIHAVQPSCAGMDLRALKAAWGDKLVFNGAIDSHHALICGRPDGVREEVRRVLEIMMPGGGYIAGASHDTILGETPVENVVAMFDAVREFGVYGSRS